jgi:hypothetical protein
MALYPALGTVLLGGGAVTTGALTAAVAAGTFLSSLFSGRVVRYRWHGRGIQRAIQVYGASILAFGAILVIGVWMPPANETTVNLGLIIAACVALAASGAADNVSSIYRSTMMQASVPDSIRGRLQGIFIIVVTGGPRVGALYAGALATVVTLWFPPLLGGFIVIALVALLVRLTPGFRDYDAENPAP